MNAMVKLGDIATLITKGTTPTTLGFSFVDAGINFFKIECIDEDGHLLPLKFAHIDTHCHEALKRSQLAENDILFSIAGAIGRTAIVPPDYLPANTNQALAIIRIPADRYNLRYILFALQSGRVAEQFEKQKQGVAQLNISLKNISDIEIPMPPEYEQDRIVRILDHVNTQISNTRKQLVYIDQLVKSRFIEMFGDPVSNPKGWPVQNFEDISILITDGEHATPRRSDNGIYLLSARNVLNHTLQLDDVDFIDEDEYSRIARRVIPQEGDVLISCSGSIGRCCVVPANMRFQMVRSAALIRFTDAINPIYAEWLITSDELQRQIAQSATQSSQANLFQGKIQKLHGYVPPKALQDEFALFVIQTDKSKFSLKNGGKDADFAVKCIWESLCRGTLT